MDRRTFLWRSVVTGGVLATIPRISHSADPSSLISWQHGLRPAHRLAVEQDKPMLVVFTAKWCTYCHKLIGEVSKNTKLAKYIETNFIPTLLDFDQETRASEVLGVESLPTTVILSPQVDLLLQKPGYMNPEVFQKTLQTALLRRAEIRQANAVTNEQK